MMMGRTPSKPTYTLTAQVVQDITSPQEAPGIIMMGKTDNEGRKDAIFLKKLNKNWNLKLSGNFHSSKFESQFVRSYSILLNKREYHEIRCTVNILECKLKLNQPGT